LAAEAELEDPETAGELAARPRTRADCAGGQRPCPWVGCRHHLALDIHPETGSIKLLRENWLEAETCSLDIAERGGERLEAVGQIMNVTRERIRQIESIALRGLRAARLRTILGL
jgi:Sigma-70, region 4